MFLVAGGRDKLVLAGMSAGLYLASAKQLQRERSLHGTSRNAISSLIDQVLTELLMDQIHIDNVADGIVEILGLPSASQ